MNVLITGGAGYIGSHTAKQILTTTKYNLTILDNLSTGSIEILKKLKKIRDFNFCQIDLKNFDEVNKLLKNGNFNTIIHFAASIVVPESVTNPTKYYLNNTANTTNLIKNAIYYQVPKFIFSSTAAVYGEPSQIPKNGIDENFATKPINPYGYSKLMSELILKDAAKVANNFNFVIFRYFNVAGADVYYDNKMLKPRIGQMFPDATHLITIASKCACRKKESITIFGTDFSTQDGTGVRDYIHVDDVAQAHILAIKYLDNKINDIFNLGYAKGYSVQNVINTMQGLGVDFKINYGSRRLGDPAILIADNNKILSKMLWRPQYDDLMLICKSAYNWEKQIL